MAVARLTAKAATSARASAAEKSRTAKRSPRGGPRGYTMGGVVYSSEPNYCKCLQGPWVEEDSCTRCGRYLSPKQLRKARR
jgi:hypothetical protein